MKNRADMSEFKPRLKAWMKRHGVKPAYLARRCCMTVQSFRNYLSNTLIPDDKVALLELIMKEVDVEKLNKRSHEPWRLLSSAFLRRDYDKLCELAAKDKKTPEEYVEELVALNVRNKWALMHHDD